MLARVTERLDPVQSAHLAGLRYVSDDQPGIRRKRSGRGFSYIGPDGRPVRDPATLLRIRHLAVPPAWTDVWICPYEDGHIQATGRDARGRKQYRYHARWHEVRDANKYERMLAFAEALPRIRAATEQHLRQVGVPRTKVLAAVLRLLEGTSIRVGNEEYARENDSFGLTTLRDEHAELQGNKVRFRFKGKSGKEHLVELNDRRLARIVKQCQDLPGQELFQYLDEEGQPHSIESADVNAYLRDISGGDFTAKDFRTWNGTVKAMRYLRVCPPAESARAGKRTITSAIKSVAAELGNTPAVCRKAYVHPVVVNAYLEGSLLPDAGVRLVGELSEEEQCVVGLLKAATEEAAAAAAAA
ncbi:MAG: DNA topoisomerase IB [Chloroflexota bacterium]|nr:DNA topoisomerase IB [Chloroflexota bacterium]